MSNNINYKTFSKIGLFLLVLITFILPYITGAQVALPTINLSASSSQIKNGENITITWSTTGASHCSGYDSWSGYRGTSGSYITKPEFSAKYTLKCWNADGGLATASILISVEQIPLPQISLTANPTTITRGDSSLISWTTSNADKCTASGGWSGNFSTSGSLSVSPINYTSYTLSCSNSLYKISRSVSITVTNTTSQNYYNNSTGSNQTGAIDITMVADPSIIRPGLSSKLSWGVVNASNCYASGGWAGTKTSYGSEFVYPTQSSNYVLTCSNGVNLKTFTATIIVSNTAPYPTPTPYSQNGYNNATQNKTSLVFLATPAVIKKGNTSILKWSSSNTTSCVASGGWSGIKSISGTEYVLPNSQTTYILTCYGQTGSTSAGALVSFENMTTTSITNTNSTTNKPKPTTSPINTNQPLSNSSFKAVCNVSKNPALIGEEVTFSTSIFGGTAPYTFIWAGAISKNGAIQNISFTTLGTKVVTLTVSDNYGKTAYTNCSTKIVSRSINNIPQSNYNNGRSPNESVSSSTISNSQITLPSGEVLSIAGSCTLTNIITCSDGRVYNLNDIKANIAESTSTTSSTTITNPTPTPFNVVTNTASSNANLLSMFVDGNNNYSWLAITITFYIIALFVVGLLVILFRVINRKTTSTN